MATKKVLIITYTKDNISIDTVSRFIKESGGEPIRFNVDQYPLHTSLTSVYQNGKWQVLLNDGEQTHDLNDVISVWNRRTFNLGTGLKETMSPEYLSPTMKELQRTLYGMVEALPCFHMERYSVYRRLDSKEEQLRMALKHGLLVPSTCISNSPELAKKFIADTNAPVITKMQSSFAVYKEHDEQVVFTNEVSQDHLEDLDGLSLCPMTFQQKLDKKLELRVTIVGGKAFTFSIDSQQVSNAKVDWRKEGSAMINNWQPYELPRDIENKLLALMNDYKLSYGAIDLILTPQDEYYFLEVNAAGEYFWLDRLCDHAISKQISHVLLNS